jgi:uncharacterized protein
LRDPVVKIFRPASVASLLAAGFLDFARRVSALLVAVGIFASANVRAAETIPPKPAGYFNDYAGAVSKEAALRLNEKLAQFERETSNQVLVAVFRKMESDSSVADYTYRVKEAWQVGQKGLNNGVVLFVFVEDHQMYIQVGYGLEAVLPDATAFDITERQIKPRFKANDFEGGLTTGVDLICKAIRGEYTGTGKTKLEERGKPNKGTGPLIILVVGIILLIAIRLGRTARGYGYSGRGGPFIGGWSSGGGNWSGGGGGWSGGSSGGGGFSGFSGGGGGGGGGGAGSSW